MEEVTSQGARRRLTQQLPHRNKQQQTLSDSLPKPSMMPIGGLRWPRRQLHRLSSH